ncbi:mycofactocin-coupled SDR family oxidoreductase [Nocardia nova]|uniref:mycofactocin-coupled SDR family oxidoreductase n=1 Tax=Nocardia nova TaxID=37330 RepID=UPI0033E71B3C
MGDSRRRDGSDGVGGDMAWVPERGSEHRRVAVVTGAARGIGAATVLALAERGWSVLAVDIAADDPALGYPLGTPGQLANVVAEAAGRVNRVGAVRGRTADVRDPAALDAAVAEAVDAWGGLDAAVAAAGVVAGGAPLWEVAPERQQAVIDICLGGVVNLARAAVPALLARPEPRSGRFLAVASAAATKGLPQLAAYCAAKAGVAGLIRALAAELGPTGVTANAVSPGSTDTAVLDEIARLYGMPDAAPFAGQQPVGRLLEPSEIAGVLAFLASSDSRAMTGAIVPVDGGLAL